MVGAEESNADATSVLPTGMVGDPLRDPRFGRGFETLGEDPYLSGQLGVANIRGVQSTGVMAQGKHLAAYNRDINRNAGNVAVDTRTLQEIYLPARLLALGRHAFRLTGSQEC